MEWLKNMKNLAATYHKFGLIHHQESITGTNFRNVLASMEEHVLGIQNGVKMPHQEAAGRLATLTNDFKPYLSTGPDNPPGIPISNVFVFLFF